MGREVRRVPIDFGWKLKEVWPGFLTPEWLAEGPCPDCEYGYSQDAERFREEWYGNAPFDPSSTGSPLLTVESPPVRAFAERNVSQSPSFYGTGEVAIVREAQRLADLWNKQWSHHLAQVDVDALIDAGRLMDLTHTFERGKGWQVKEPEYRPAAQDVNAWSIGGFGHDSINASVAVRARCAREGLPELCATCGGHGTREKFAGQRAAAEAWQLLDPPEGDGWQLWETVSEGSPVSPVFSTALELAAHLNPDDPTASLAWVEGGGWAPSLIVAGGVVTTADEIAAGHTSVSDGPSS